MRRKKGFTDGIGINYGPRNPSVSLLFNTTDFYLILHKSGKVMCLCLMESLKLKWSGAIKDNNRSRTKSYVPGTFSERPERWGETPADTNDQ